jgi:sugar O-acyltransferase (sialic acid O-acetyltransferase NeuD family)
MKKVAIIGAGGHTRSLINLIEYNGISIIGIFDDSYKVTSKEFIDGYPLKGKIDDCLSNVDIILSVGDNDKRGALFYKLFPSVLKDNLFHPKSMVEKGVTFGVSNQIFSYAYINSATEIGDNNIINTGAIIEHEVKIGSNNHISVHATICGRASMGSNCFIGAGAVVIDKITIGDNVIIGTNSVVIENIFEAGVYVGNPVRRIK